MTINFDPIALLKARENVCNTVNDKLEKENPPPADVAEKALRSAILMTSYSVSGAAFDETIKWIISLDQKTPAA